MAPAVIGVAGHRRAGRRELLAQEPQLGMDQAVVFAPDLFHVLPQTLLDVERPPVQFVGEIVVLLANRFAEVLLDHAGSQVERRLKLGHGAQKMDLAGGSALFDAGAPFVGMLLEILSIRSAVS